MFKLPYAVCNDRYYTPQQWQSKHELQNKSKKNTTNETLMCPIGCKVTFHKAVDYTMKNGTRVHRRAHFAHVGEHGDRCLYVQKYSGGGESKEHKDAKNNLMYEPYKKFFYQFCSSPGCTNNRNVCAEYEGGVSAKAEIRLNKWLFDVVYYDNDGILQIIEVKATHATDNEKRKWVIENYGEKYIEVGTRPLQTNVGHAIQNWEVIDFHETYTCDACKNKEQRPFDDWNGVPDFENSCDLCGGTGVYYSSGCNMPCPGCGSDSDVEETISPKQPTPIPVPSPKQPTPISSPIPSPKQPSPVPIPVPVKVMLPQPNCSLCGGTGEYGEYYGCKMYCHCRWSD